MLTVGGDNGRTQPPEWWCYDDSTVNSFTASTTLQQLQDAPQRRVDLRKPANVVSEETAAAKWTPQSTCPQACNGQGTCVEGKCVCHFNSGFRGPACADSYEPFCMYASSPTTMSSQFLPLLCMYAWVWCPARP